MRARWLPPLVAVALLLAAWQLYTRASAISPLLLPAPTAVLRALVRDRAAIWHNLLPTALEIVLGVLIAGALSLVFALALHVWPPLRRALYPLLVASQAIPVVFVAPLLVLWLGFGLAPKLVVIGLVCFFPIVVSTLAGLQAVDPDLLKLARTLGADRRQLLWRIELPSALPGLFSGAKVAVVFAVIGAVFGEQAGASSGLGYLLTVTVGNLQTAEAFATVLVLAAFAILLFGALTLAERRALPWIHRDRQTT